MFKFLILPNIFGKMDLEKRRKKSKFRKLYDEFWSIHVILK